MFEQKTVWHELLLLYEVILCRNNIPFLQKNTYSVLTLCPFLWNHSSTKTQNRKNRDTCHVLSDSLKTARRSNKIKLVCGHASCFHSEMKPLIWRWWTYRVGANPPWSSLTSSLSLNSPLQRLTGSHWMQLQVDPHSVAGSWVFSRKTTKTSNHLVLGWMTWLLAEQSRSPVVHSGRRTAARQSTSILNGPAGLQHKPSLPLPSRSRPVCDTQSTTLVSASRAQLTAALLTLVFVRVSAPSHSNTRYWQL